MDNKKVLKFLDNNNIKYKLHKHPAVFTCEEAEKYCSEIPGMHCKNLFIKSKKGNNFYLVILPAEKRMDLKFFSNLVGEKITFCNDDELYDKLKLTRGSVSPFGLLNDKKSIINVYIDEDLYESDIVSFHPNTNTQTLEIKKKYFHNFISLLNNNIEIYNF